MKKALSILMILLMIISTMPVMAIHSSAAEVMGDWTTYRASDGYNPPPEGEDPSYTPAPESKSDEIFSSATSVWGDGISTSKISPVRILSENFTWRPSA